ncbi:MAG: hypothetical protein P4L53_08130 [Candidatus Obscuribacterales bacterium]|nr:hypothetical protein [Candidatus Obscuribacterales bacterium]
MSGTLMDGGGQGGDGAAFNSHNQSMGDSVSFDASHSNQSGHTQVGAGGDGYLANLLGQNGQHSFLGHLLGLDAGTNVAHGHGAPGGNGAGHAPSQSVIWTSALQALKVSNIVDGLKFTPAMGMFCLFLGFVSWLFVVYFIRHHEPFANSVLGTMPQSLGVSTDRRLIDGVKGAMPFKTSKATGDFYTPLPGGAQNPAIAPAIVSQPIVAPAPFASAPIVTSSFGSPRNYNEASNSQSEPASAFQQYSPQSVVSPPVQNGFVINPYYATPAETPARVAKFKVFTNH